MIPLKYKSWVWNKRLSHTIHDAPSQITGKEESARYVQFDDLKIILNVSGWRVTPLVWLMLFIAGAKGMSEGIDINSIEVLSIRGVVEVIALFISVISVLLAVVALAWFMFYRNKFVIFDRSKGLVSIPGPFWYKNVEIPFEDVVAIIRRENRYYGTAKVLNLYRPDGYKVDVGINTHDLDELKRDWAFYVWYMDKNRPLPPSPVFDKYRESSFNKPALERTA